MMVIGVYLYWERGESDDSGSDDSSPVERVEYRRVGGDCGYS